MQAITFLKDAGRDTTVFEGSMYHIFAAQCQTQFPAGETPNNQGSIRWINDPQQAVSAIFRPIGRFKKGRCLVCAQKSVNFCKSLFHMTAPAGEAQQIEHLLGKE